MAALPPDRRVQTNLRLTAERAAALDIASVVEQKDKAAIVEEALQLREALMSQEYQGLIRAALALRFSADPVERLEAIETLREEIPGAIPNGSVSVSAALAKLHARARQPR
jgi:hypothetical protein